MILSPRRRFGFVHIPKTGGTALSLGYEARAAGDDILIGDTPKARARRHRLKALTPRGRLWKHATLADVDGVLPPGALEGWFFCTLVRNPWDRAVSYYHWLLAQRFDHPAVGLAKSHDFSGFLHHPDTAQAFRDWPARAYMTAADGREYCSAFLRLEHLATDLAPLEAHLGFALALPHANRSARAADWRGYYSDRDAAHLARLCAEDIGRFGYGFDDAAGMTGNR